MPGLEFRGQIGGQRLPHTNLRLIQYTSPLSNLLEERKKYILLDNFYRIITQQTQNNTTTHFNKLLENEMKQFCNVTKDITRNFVIKYAYFYSTSKTLASIENTRNCLDISSPSPPSTGMKY